MNFLEKFETQSKEETIKFLSEQLGLRALQAVSETEIEKHVQTPEKTDGEE